ncbi:MAG: hypothetical protein MRJ65_08240 [Candidatus Brocadiaceae bacterium]|nr:hypothetical protein [Candidatus Brocadiaceae bacterium]
MNDADNGAYIPVNSKRSPLQERQKLKVASQACDDGDPVNEIVFERIKEYDPLLFINTGDFHYGNINGPDLNTNISDHQILYENRLNVTGLSVNRHLYIVLTSFAYMWDDHDLDRMTAMRKEVSH